MYIHTFSFRFSFSSNEQATFDKTDVYMCTYVHDAHTTRTHTSDALLYRVWLSLLLCLCLQYFVWLGDILRRVFFGIAFDLWIFVWCSWHRFFCLCSQFLLHHVMHEPYFTQYTCASCASCLYCVQYYCSNRGVPLFIRPATTLPSQKNFF